MAIWCWHLRVAPFLRSYLSSTHGDMLIPIDKIERAHAIYATTVEMSQHLYHYALLNAIALHPPSNFTSHPFHTYHPIIDSFTLLRHIRGDVGGSPILCINISRFVVVSHWPAFKLILYV